MDDLILLAAPLGALLKTHGATVAVAESSAGGLVSAALLAVPGASAYYKGGLVAYTYESRSVFLQPGEDAFAGLKPSTEAYALQMARLARERLGTTWAIAETGAAGPTGSRYGYPAGHACIAVAGPLERALTIETRSAARESNMWAFARAALELLAQCVAEHGQTRSA